MTKFKCQNCGYEKELKDGEVIKRCPKCGYAANIVPVKLDFKKDGDWIKIVQSKTYYKSKKDILKELETGIVTEEEKIEEAKTNIKILKDRMEKVKKL